MGKPAGKPRAVRETRVRKEPTIVAYEQRCTSPRGVCTFVHKTDVLNGNLADAQERSKAIVNKYKKQGWRVTVRAVTI